MCTMVNSRNNWICKMFSVVKYLVLIFTFIFVGMCSSSMKSSALELDNSGNSYSKSFVEKLYGISSSKNSSGFLEIGVTFAKSFGYGGYYYEFGYRKGVIIDAQGTDTGENWVGEKQLFNTQKSGKDNRSVNLVFYNKHIYNCSNYHTCCSNNQIPHSMNKC